MPSKTKSVRVFDYTDYRKYLSDYYKQQKKSNPAFSYRYFASKASINSVGLYKDVIDGRRNLGRDLIARFSKALKLGKREAEYFENMVFFCEAKNTDEKKHYFSKMMASYESKAYKVESRKYEYYAKWYYSAIRALLSCFPKLKDPAAISKMLEPGVRQEQAKSALRILLDLGFIRQTGSNEYELSDPIVTTGTIGTEKRIEALNAINFQKAMMQLATEAYDRHPFEKMSMSTLTLGVSEETFEEMKEEIAALRRKFANLAARDSNPNKVYQLNYQFFPLIKS